jgi:glutathione synthase/RimK-type ligase-like ATP-grasp enzyme
VTINATLQMARIPLPRFWVSANLSRLHRLIPPSAYPIVLKSSSTAKGKITVLQDTEGFRHYITGLGSAVIVEQTLFYSEEYLRTDGSYIKLYACHANVAAYRKFSDLSKRPEHLPVTRELRKLARCIGEAVDLDFFSADAVSGKHNLTVIDVNPFPIFKYHTGAYDWLADVLWKRAQHHGRNK